jgi:CRISPR/Cas system CSM-associated protein Csm4 (group 5 of RAMP superfamily)
MPSSFIVRFRPTGPWRFGPDSGARDRVEPICHSDAVFSAVTNAMARLGMLEGWLAATTQAESGAPDVRFSSLYPFQRDTLLVAPPRSIWPPPPSAKVRYKAARLVPLAVVESLAGEKPLDDDRWVLDGESECLVPADRSRHGGPFRIGLRSNAAVDRLTPGAVEPHATACLEFGPDAGLWMLVIFPDDEAQSRWMEPVRSALRLLADSGIGGERSRGWGRSVDPEWNTAPDFLAAAKPESDEIAYWLLSVFAPAQDDTVDWNSGNYATVSRSGRVESTGRWGEVRWGELKRTTMMVAEGSVLLSPSPPRGAVRDVAPEGFPHPVFRAGFAVTIPIPWRAPA